MIQNYSDFIQNNSSMSCTGAYRGKMLWIKSTVSSESLSEMNVNASCVQENQNAG